MFVRNKSEILDLARNKEEKKKIQDLLNLTEFIIQEAQPSVLMSNTLDISEDTITVGGRQYSLSNYCNIYIIAFGKASQNMLKWFLERFPTQLSQLILVSPDNLDPFFENQSKLTYFRGGHPTPNEQSFKAAENVLNILKHTTKNDLCILLISGGGSALLEFPDYSITFSDYEELVNMLLNSNASIQEINTIRKHFSKIKGGKLAQKTEASILSIILSDVSENDISSIASGPTAPDKTTWQDCHDIIMKLGLLSSIPKDIGRVLTKGVNGHIGDTLANEGCFSHVQNHIVGDNSKLLRTIKTQLENFNYSEILNESVVGEAREMGQNLASYASQKIAEIRSTFYLIFGGETTVTLKSMEGLGGRNQELSLAFALSLSEDAPLYLLSFGTDGIDGNSQAAGAIVGPFTLKEDIRDEAKKFLEDNDSNGFFKKYGGEIITGYTGTNLMDVGIIYYSEN